MRLGIVGMLPGDFRTFTDAHFHAIRTLGFTGAGFHFPGDLINQPTPEDAARCKGRFAAHRIDLAQFAITCGDCLFDPDPDARQATVQKIARGAQIAAQLNARTYLIRPGSLNPAGPWTPHRDNHRPDAMERLIQTLKTILPHLEAEGVTAVLETHAISILNTPETCRSIVETVNSPRLRLVMDPVNHFESLRQVYAGADHLNHIFDLMGTLSPVCHIKDIAVGNRLVIHLDETVPGEGELDMALLLHRFHTAHPHGYALIEHLGPDQIPTAAENVRRIAAGAGIPIH